MKIALALIAIIVGGLLLVAVILGIYGVSTYNRAQALHTQYDSKVKANSAVFDNMWKKIQQTAQVPEAQKNAFKDIFTSYAEARSGTGGDSASVIGESSDTAPLVCRMIFCTTARMSL